MANPLSASRAQILVVEDENIVALDIERGLKRLGYSVPEVVNNGAEAILKAGEIRPSLVLMDIQLKGDMDGIEAANQIRNLYNIPVVFLTAYADEATLQRAKQVEPYGYLLKPFEETELHTAIEVVLQKHKSIEEKLAVSKANLILSEERFKLFIESIKDYAIFMLDPAGNIISWNPGAERIKGYRSEEVIGKPFSIFYLKEDVEARLPERELEIAAMHGRHEQEYWRIRRDGTKFWADVVITALRDDKGVLRGFGKVVRDLTIKKRDSDALTASLAKEEQAKQRLSIQYNIMSMIAGADTLNEAGTKMLRLIVQSLRWHVGILWVVNESKNTISASEFWCSPKLADQSFIEDSKNRHFTIGQGLPGIIWENQHPEWIQDLALTPHFLRLKSATKTGLRGALGFPLISGKKVLGVMEFFSQEARHPDSDLLQTITTLGGQIGQFMKRLITEEELRSALGERDEFLSIASHELKTPLTALFLQLQMLNRNLNRIDVSSISEEFKAVLNFERIIKSLSACERQGQRLSTLLDELLDLTRVRLGRLELKKCKVDLSKLVRETVTHLIEQTKFQPQITFKIESEIIGDWDQNRIEQVVTNLVSNAIKYGEGKPIEISVNKNLNQGFACIIVEDHGMGIPKDLQGKIFERFERASSLSISGLGLGLYITRQIMEAHEGEISVESQPGKGSIFKAILPIQKKGAAIC